ncbi:MAG: PEP-CTERM sorting domain-containing protein [Planctomycetota bacterium]
MPKTLCLLVAFLFLLASEATSAVVDFDSASDLDQFVGQNQFQFTPITHSENGGVGGSGGLLVSGRHRAGFIGETVNLSQPNTSVVISTFFKIQDPGDVPSNSFFTLGDAVLSRSFAWWNNDRLSASLSSSSTELSLSFTQSTGNTGTGVGQRFSRDLVNFGNWYELRAQFDSLPGSRIGWSLDFNDYGADGTTFQGNAISFQANTNDNNGVFADTTLFAGFSGVDQSMTFIDNFSITTIPEPSSLFALLIGTMSIGFRRRRLH